MCGNKPLAACTVPAVPTQEAIPEEGGYKKNLMLMLLMLPLFIMYWLCLIPRAMVGELKLKDRPKHLPNVGKQQGLGRVRVPLLLGPFRKHTREPI